MLANFYPFGENALRHLAKIIENKYQDQSVENNSDGLTRLYDTFWPGKRNITKFFQRANCKIFAGSVPENERTYWTLVSVQSEVSPDGINKIFKVIEQLCDVEEYYDDPKSHDDVIEQVNQILRQYNYKVLETGNIVRYPRQQQILEQTIKSRKKADTSQEASGPPSLPQAGNVQKSIHQQDLKNHIRSWVKANRKIDSPLGEVIIGKPLGEGGNALVYDSLFAGGAAIKFLAESVTSPPSTRYARFLDEYRNLIKLVPKAVIVPLYNLGIQEMDGVHIPYILMERCVKTLYDTYKSNKLASAKEFQSLLDRLLEVLEVLHTAGIIHRDIKPQNILLRADGTWVLGDFGIAWFDPELHTKLAVSEKNERLANFEFSAPEQVKRQAYEKATSCMDLYALGQTLYFCVTGQTIRGSRYPHFSQFVPELASYDSLIERLVRQIPHERFQTVQETRQFLKQENTRDLRLYIEEEQLRRKFQWNLDNFDLALRSAMPGSHRYVQAKKEDAGRLMTALASCREKCDLWWFKSLANNPVSTLVKLPEDIWLVDCHECEIVDLWIYRNATKLAHQFVTLELAPRPPFGIYSSRDSERNSEEAGFFNGKYISRAEFDDGFALIDGEVIQLDGTEKIRIRNLKRSFLILAPNGSTFNNVANDRQVHDIFKLLLSQENISSSILSKFDGLKQPEWKS